MRLAHTIQARMNATEHHYSQAKLAGKQSEAAKHLAQLDKLWSDWENLYVDAMSGLEIR